MDVVTTVGSEAAPRTAATATAAGDFEFDGTALEALGRILVAALAGLLVVPAAWGIVPAYRWFFSRLRLRNGTTATFVGEPGEIWWAFAGLVAVAYVQVAISRQTKGFLASLLVQIVALLATSALSLHVVRWVTRNIHLSTGRKLSFTGDLASLFGWNVLVSVSFYTIIGWGWAYAALQRWFCRNVDGGEWTLRFDGRGHQILWRTLVTGLASMLVVPIPWVILWFGRWFLSQTRIVAREGTASGATRAI